MPTHRVRVGDAEEGEREREEGGRERETERGRGREKERGRERDELLTFRFEMTCASLLSCNSHQ